MGLALNETAEAGVRADERERTEQRIIAIIEDAPIHPIYKPRLIAAIKEHR
jgi:hypothetical protein